MAIRGLRAIRKRIRAVASTQKITKAMKMVSAAKFRRAQEAILAARPYADGMEQAVREVVGRVRRSRGLDERASVHPLLDVRPLRRAVVVVVTADRGLCGAYNTNILRRSEGLLRELRDRGDVSLVTVGRKGRDHFRRRNRTVRTELVADPRPAGEIARALAADLQGFFLREEADEVWLVWSHFVSAVSQRPQAAALLPLTVPEAQEGTAPGYGFDLLYEPTRAAVLDRLLPAYVATRLQTTLMDATASEHGARMTAMENARKNCEEMIATLTLQMNKARQAGITKDLMDIVNGAEALRHSA